LQFAMSRKKPKGNCKMQIAKCKLQIGQLIGHGALATLLLITLSFPAIAASARDDLLRLVPEDVGFCLVIQDLRAHSEAFLRSPFVKKWWESPIGKAIANAPEQKKLAEFETQLKEGLGVTFAQLRDDIFGDAIIFAYRPGGPGKEDREVGLMLVHARDAKLLAEVTSRFNELQKQSGDLKDVLDRAHRGVKYQCRVERHTQNYAYLHGSLLAFSTNETMIQQVIDLEQKTSKDDSPILGHLRRLGAGQAVAVLWVNPRAFDAAFEEKAKQLHGPEAAIQQAVQNHWRAVDGVALWAKVKESEIDLALAVSAKTDALPAPTRAAFTGEAKPSDVWRGIPDNALLAIGGRFDAAAWNDFLSGLLPEEQRKAVREAARKFAGPALGKNVATDVLPLLGPDWAVCVLTPRTGDKGWFPHTIWALRIQPGGIDRALLNALNSLALLAVFAYNGNHQDQMTFHALDKMDGGYLSNDTEFPPGFQPAFTLKDGFLILASSPDAIGRFNLPSPKGTTDRQADAAIREIPLLRISLRDLSQYLSTYQNALVDHIAKKNQVPKTDAANKLEALSQLCQLFNRIELVQRSNSGLLTLTLRVQTAVPLSTSTQQ
jgi:hypothetical protein